MQRARLFLVPGFAVLFMWGAVSVSAQEHADPKTGAAPADGSRKPLASSDRRLLLGLIAPPCPLSVPGGPETKVEAEAREALDGAWEPVMPEGTFELVGDGVWAALCSCRLTDVRRVS